MARAQRPSLRAAALAWLLGALACSTGAEPSPADPPGDPPLEPPSSTPAAIAARHARWRSVALGVDRLDPAPVSGAANFSKLWKTEVAADGRVLLHETTALSPVPRVPTTSVDEWRQKREGWLRRGVFADNTKWGSETIEISDAIDVFALDMATLTPVRVEIRSLPEDRFEVAAFDGEKPVSLVVFVPYEKKELLPPVTTSFDGYHFPFTDRRYLERLDALPKPIPADGGILRHDLGRVRRVWIQPTFPKALVPAVRAAMVEWNDRAFRQQFFVEASELRPTPKDCLTSEDLLCIYWTGREELSWLVGGVTQLAFDPADGTILGSSITIQNFPPGLPLRPTPPDVTASYAARSFSLATLAGHQLAPNQLAAFSHPEPARLLMHVMLHEMGHACGLPHYFGASREGTPSVPSDTVMDYLPTPLWAFVDALGPRDVGKIDAMHRGVATPPEVSCDDFGVIENPNCRTWDFGEPATWYRTMADLDPGALFRTIPNEGGADRYLNRTFTVADRLIQFVTPNPWSTDAQRTSARDYLCARRSDPADAERLDLLLQQKHGGLDLGCP